MRIRLLLYLIMNRHEADTTKEHWTSLLMRRAALLSLKLSLGFTLVWLAMSGRV